MIKSAIQTATVTLLLAAIWLLTELCAAQGQPKFLANFDNNGPVTQGQFGPSNLISQGWIFRVQATQPVVQGFFDGFPNWFAAETGPGYLASDPVLQFTSPYGAWAILPAVPGQTSGDPLTFWVQGITDQTAYLEARYSPTGGTNTGTGPNDVGDFTSVLFKVGPIPNGGWQQFSANLPGAGRIALRIVGQYDFVASGGPYVGIDNLTVGTPLAPPCNLPPQPAAGQTVTWTLAKSPYQICTDLAIPQGGTVNVEPGVQIQAQQHTLSVTGALNAVGITTKHISFSAQDVFPPAITMLGGNLNLAFTDITGQIRGGPGALTVSDSVFTGPNGVLWTPDILTFNPPVMKLTRSTFNNSLAVISDSYAVLRGCKFNNTQADVLRGYLLLLGTNTWNGQPLIIDRETAQTVQPMFVDGVKARNVKTGGGIILNGGDFFLGAKNVLQGNLYPLEVHAGLLPSSSVPLTGNTHNLIWAHNGGTGMFTHWANLKMPYLVDEFLFPAGGQLTIDPGTTVLFDPSRTGFAGLDGGRLIARGLPSAPITFDALNPSVPWSGLEYAENLSQVGTHLDYAVVKNAQGGVGVSDGYLDITNSVFEQNGTAIGTNTFGSASLSKTQVLNNGIGVFATPEGGFLVHAADLSPNWFQGNGTGVLNQGPTIPAQNNYWGSTTGPNNSGNPGGQGDAIIGAVTFKPFLTSPPDMATNPPVVSLLPLGNAWFGAPPNYVLTPGEKLILQWNVSNSATVVSQRILLSPEGPVFNVSQIQPIVVADNIPASARTLEITVPNVPYAASNMPQFLRVVAIDSLGQQGWDETPVTVSDGSIVGDLQITSSCAGKTYIAGHNDFPPVTWTGITNGSEQGTTFLEADGSLLGTMVSTDTVRMVVVSHNNSNAVKWFFAPRYCTIRLDPALGVKAPAVKLTSPSSNSSFSGGSVVPITWTASAQQGLRSFDIQVSTNGGQTFHYVAKDLPAAARSYNWQLPASTGIPDVRVRVTAKDRLFQNSSDGANVVFSITP